MKKMFGRLLLLISCFSIGFLSFNLFSTNSKATYFQWKWDKISFQGDVLLRPNIDYAHSSYSGTTFTDGMNLWADKGANVIMTISPFSSSDVDVSGVSESTWTSNGWGNGMAWTQPFKTDGTICMPKPISDYTLKCPTGTKVDYAAIYTNNGSIIASSKRKALIAHELGHVMGLAHTAFITEKAKSIMTQSLAGGLVPSTYDVNEVNSRY